MERLVATFNDSDPGLRAEIWVMDRSTKIGDTYDRLNDERVGVPPAQPGGDGKIFVHIGAIEAYANGPRDQLIKRLGGKDPFDFVPALHHEFVETRGIQKLMSDGKRYGALIPSIVVTLIRKRSDVVRGLNPQQAEILIRGGAKVGEYAVVPSGALSCGPTDALVRSARVTGAAVAPAGAAGDVIGETIRGD